MTAPDTPGQDQLLLLLPRLRRYARVLTADLRRADQRVLETLASEKRSPPTRWPQLRLRLFAVMHRLHRERSAQEPGKQRDETPQWLSRLRVEQREVLALAVLERLPYADIAALLDVPIATVMSRLRCAREGMRPTSADSMAPGPAGK